MRLVGGGPGRWSCRYAASALRSVGHWTDSAEVPRTRATTARWPTTRSGCSTTYRDSVAALTQRGSTRPTCWDLLRPVPRGLHPGRARGGLRSVHRCRRGSLRIGSVGHQPTGRVQCQLVELSGPVTGVDDRSSESCPGRCVRPAVGAELTCARATNH